MVTSPEEREDLAPEPAADLEERSRDAAATARQRVDEARAALDEGTRRASEGGKAVADRATDVVDEALDWLTAVGLGIRDTAKEMLDRGREGARDAYRDYWRKYDEKTVLRREQPQAPSRDRKTKKGRRF